MTQYVLYKDEAKKALTKGINIIAEAVAVTLGPRGRNVVLDRKQLVPKIVNDGVTIAKEISLTDSIENTGAALLKEAAAKTNETAGDGTTTSTILASIMIKEGLKKISVGLNAIALKKGMNKAVCFVSDKLIESARPVKTYEDILQIATISAGNDAEIGHTIAEAFIKSGREGIITVEEGQSTRTQLEITEGMQFDKGFLSPYFVDKSEDKTIIKNNPYILLTTQSLSLVQKQIVPILELMTKIRAPLIIIAKDIEKKALGTLIINKVKGIVDITAVKAPGFGNFVAEFIEDIAVLTQGTIISEESGIKFNKLKLEMLGRCRQIIITSTTTIIIANKVSPEVSRRCDNLRLQLEYSDSIYEKDKLRERLAKLSGGVAVIKVGATTETEMHDKKLRLEDALNATRAALGEGIITGGGSTLTHISKKLNWWSQNTLFGDEFMGAQIVALALRAPLQRIAFNSGKNGAVIIEMIESSTSNIGYNALKDEFNDLFTAGVIDPTKVSRCALQNAASIASMVLTTECLIVEE